MAVAPVSFATLLPPLRATDFLPAAVPPAAAGANPAALFSQVVESALATGSPVPSAAAAGNLPGISAASVLDQAFLRDLVSGFTPATAAIDALRLTPAFTSDLGIEGALGRNGLPDLLRHLDDRQASAVIAAATNLYDALQSLGEESDGGPEVGALLDISA